MVVFLELVLQLSFLSSPMWEEQTCEGKVWMRTYMKDEWRKRDWHKWKERRTIKYCRVKKLWLDGNYKSTTRSRIWSNEIAQPKKALANSPTSALVHLSLEKVVAFVRQGFCNQGFLDLHRVDELKKFVASIFLKLVC